MNPLLPVVKELAEELVRLRSGKLYAKSSTEGPRDLEELRVLLERAGMWAAAWMIEAEQAAYLPVVEPEPEEEDETVSESAKRIEAIAAVLQESIPIWRMLKRIQHVIYGDDVPTPSAPSVLKPQWHDDVPF